MSASNSLDERASRRCFIVSSASLPHTVMDKVRSQYKTGNLQLPASNCLLMAVLFSNSI